MSDATEGEMFFIGVIAAAIAPHLFEGGHSREAAASACARLAGSILGELIESGGLPYATFPVAIEALNVATVDEFEKFLLGGGTLVQ